MGMFLNAASDKFLRCKNSPYFVDKSLMLAKLFPLCLVDDRYVCVTRPRRFGKSTNAQMMAAFFGKQPCPELFEDLQIAAHPDYAKHLNQHNVVFCTFNKQYKATTITEWLEKIERKIQADLQEAYPDCDFADGDSLFESFEHVQEQYPGEKFIFIFDEWDEVFNFDFMTTAADKRKYENWLRDLFKDQDYVEFAYLTGIRPLVTVSPGSALNMVENFTLLGDERFREDFGFTQKEVDGLYDEYLSSHDVSQVGVTKEELEYWYDGYDTTNGVKLYNPRSVCLALKNNKVSNYWTGTSSVAEVFDQIKHNVPAVAADIQNLVAGLEIPPVNYNFTVVTGIPKTRDQILSAMVAYGFLTMKDATVRIPNYELQLRFAEMLREYEEFGICHKIAANSRELLNAIKFADSDLVAQKIEFVHQHLAPQERFNNEAEFAAVFRLGFLGIQGVDYDWEVEVKAGSGKADMVLTPINPNNDLIIIELKVDATPEQAIAQIKDRNYQKMADGLFYPNYTGRIIAVGVTYQRNTIDKQHHCAIQVLREAS